MELILILALLGLAYAHFKLHLTLAQVSADIKQIINGGTK